MYDSVVLCFNYVGLSSSQILSPTRTVVVIYKPTHITHAYLCTRTHIHTCIQHRYIIHTRMLSREYVHLCSHRDESTYIHTHLCIHTNHTYICTHIYKHVYIHTQSFLFFVSLLRTSHGWAPRSPGEIIDWGMETPPIPTQSPQQNPFAQTGWILWCFLRITICTEWTHRTSGRPAAWVLPPKLPNIYSPNSL